MSDLQFFRIQIDCCGCVVISRNQRSSMLPLKPDTGNWKRISACDVREIGDWETGELALILRNVADMERAKLLLEGAYQKGRRGLQREWR